MSFHTYRADGIRVTCDAGPRLIYPPLNYPRHYRYDGQMPVETPRLDVQASTTTVSRNRLGARGIDCLSTTTSSGTAVSYPVDDAHGNMVATLGKVSGGFTVSNRRAYDAWGGIRQGTTSGNPKGRYCASIGHVQDDESSLVYMRARYYDPSSGRFVSEDATKDGLNWVIYCADNPVNGSDYSGNATNWVSVLVRLAAVINGIFRSDMFRPMMMGLIVGGLVSFTCCGLGALIGIAAMAAGITQGIMNLSGIVKLQGWLPKFSGFTTDLAKIYPEARSRAAYQKSYPVFRRCTARIACCSSLWAR